MIIALNGYSEHDATYGLIVWLVLALICTLLVCVAAFVIASLIEAAKRRVSVICGGFRDYCGVRFEYHLRLYRCRSG